MTLQHVRDFVTAVFEREVGRHGVSECAKAASKYGASSETTVLQFVATTIGEKKERVKEKEEEQEDK